MPKTGATRYQKFLKSEKAKTKLKSKKDLPKGTNVTKTTFKVKKIVIKDQLKKHNTNEILSTRKLNIKELLSRLSHFNTNSRNDALDGLKEMITGHPQLLDQYLGLVIQGVTPLVLNIEKLVRRESLKVLHLILSHASLEKLRPFYDVMSTYLRSAMTHIDNRIQEDSLLFLDIMLKYTSKYIAEDFHKIIPIFLDMISKLRIDSKPGRTLTINMGSQITTVKWRAKVLQRLQEFLQKYIVFHNISNLNTGKICSMKKFDVSKLNYYSLFDSNYTSVCYVSCFSSKNAQGFVPIDEVEKFKAYFETLMNLLFETWLEVCPKTGSENNIETVINEEVAVLLHHILKVISLLWQLVQYLQIKNPSSGIQSFFCKKYGQPFGQNFIKSFPYVTNIHSKQTKLTNTMFEDTVTDQKTVADNLVICYLFIIFGQNISVENQKDFLSTFTYIESMFNKSIDVKETDIIINILSAIYCDEKNIRNRTLTVEDTLFKKIINAYFKNKNMTNVFKEKLFNILCQVALNDKLSRVHDCESFRIWLTNLPDILLNDSLSMQTIGIIYKFAISNNIKFNEVVKNKLSSIIENLPRIKISDATSDTCYHKLFSLLYWIKCYDENSLNILEKQLLDNIYLNEHSKYIFDTLQLRSNIA